MRGRLAKTQFLFSAILVCISTAGKAGKFENTDERDLRKIEDEITRDYVAGKTAAFERYYADTVSLVNDDGTTNTKAQLVADIKSGALKCKSSKLDQVRVQLYGDTAVITFRTDDKATYKKQDISGKHRFIDVFVRKNGQWLMVSEQSTKITK